MKFLRLFLFSTLMALSSVQAVVAHHVLGRPSYALNEDSNTPPAMQVETLIGNYDVNYMVFPAFPRPGQPGRVHLYIRNAKTMKSFEGKVNFSVRDDSFLSKFGLGSNEEQLGAQLIDDFVYRQGFLFKLPGDYIITARFEADKEPYIIDFPLQIGAPSPWGPISISVAVIVAFLLFVGLVQRRRAMTGKIRSQHQGDDT